MSISIAGVTYAKLKAYCKKQNWAFFDDGDYNLNIIGIRAADRAVNTFNDVICVAFKQAGQPQLLVFNATTDPGAYYRNNPLSVEGTAWLQAGQQRGVWQMGKHQGKYPALVQRKPIRFVRKSANGDVSEPETGYIGINLHRASEAAIADTVDTFSAGCQVIADPLEYQLFIQLCALAAKRYGNAFTYTLIEEDAADV